MNLFVQSFFSLLARRQTHQNSPHSQGYFIKTQQLERTNGTVRQQTGRWHRRQNKFSKIWEQTEVTVRLVITYFNWIWIHSRKENTAAMRARLATAPWNWDDLITYPTLL